MGFNEEFIKWVLSEISVRDWNQSDLSRAAAVPHSTISSMLNGMRSPGPGVCNGIARAFNLPPSTVFIRAGLMDPEPDQTTTEKEICHKLNLLPPDKKEVILDLVDSMLTKRK